MADDLESCLVIFIFTQSMLMFQIIVFGMFLIAFLGKFQ